MFIFAKIKTKMLSIRAIYDGRKLTLLEKVAIKSPMQVIVTFLDETDISPAELHYLSAKGGALDFLNEPKEDIYSDKDLKVKYPK